MRRLIILTVDLITTVLRLVRPGGLRAVIIGSRQAHQPLILSRSCRRARNLRFLGRLISGFCSLWIESNRLRRVAIAVKPSTLLNVQNALTNQQVRRSLMKLKSIKCVEEVSGDPPSWRLVENYEFR